jgi:hypothetical protein
MNLLNKIPFTFFILCFAMPLAGIGGCQSVQISPRITQESKTANQHAQTGSFPRIPQPYSFVHYSAQVHGHPGLMKNVVPMVSVPMG